MSETWQAIIQLILTPTLIVGFLAFVMRELFKSYLSMDVEKYKTQLKSESDARQFEFQTKFSSWHKQQAEAIKELYSLIAEMEIILNDVNTLIGFMDGTDKNSINNEFWTELSEELRVKQNKLVTFFKINQIYFTSETCRILDETINAIDNVVFENLHYLSSQTGMMKGLGRLSLSAFKHFSLTNIQRNKIPNEKLKRFDKMDELTQLKTKLEMQFRKLMDVDFSSK